MVWCGCGGGGWVVWCVVCGVGGGRRAGVPYLHWAGEEGPVGAQAQVRGLDSVELREVDEVEGDEVKSVHLEDAHRRPAVHLRERPGGRGLSMGEGQGERIVDQRYTWRGAREG